MLPQVVLLTIGAYLLGAVPTAYIAARLIKGIDIRSYGSGSVSGSNVWASVARWAVIPVGIADILKGLIPVLIAQLADFSVAAQGIVGLAAVAGHNWSIFLRFTGGRGIATMMGVLVLLAPWELVVFIGIWLIGIAVLNTPLGALLAGVSLPFASWGFGEPLSLTLCLMAMALLLMIKRLTANLSLGAFVGEWKRVVVYRLLFDRDIRLREAWVYRKPRHPREPSEKSGEGKNSEE
jgi:glycerol-3-phosphate acyltransferase PlsY